MTHRSNLYRRAGILAISVIVGLALSGVLYSFRHALMEAAVRLDGADVKGGSDIGALVVVHGGIWARLTENLLFMGPIPYSILCTFLICIAYIAVGWFARMWPSARDAARDASVLQDALGNAGSDAKSGIEDALGTLSMKSELGARLSQVYDAYQVQGDKQDAQSENDRLAGIAEVSGQLSLQPLSFGEWLLPVLGFVGTVWGVILAVADLQAGIVELFTKRDLTPEALGSFGKAFEGLGLAFYTTLQGLVGLTIVGAATFCLRRRVVKALAIVEDSCGRAVMGLPSESVIDLLRKGLFVTNKEGELTLTEDGRPQLVLARWLQEIHRGMLLTDEHGNAVLTESGDPKLRLAQVLEEMHKGLLLVDSDGELILDDDGNPQLRLETWMWDLRAGLFLANEEGELARDENGAPIERAADWREVIRRGLFVTDETGALVVGEDKKPIPRLRGAVEALANKQALIAWLLTQELLEVTKDEAWQIATGTIESTRGMRDVMLANRNERRFRQLAGELQFIEYLLESVGQPKRTTTPDAAPLLGQRILAPNGSPVRCAALDADRFAVARETGKETNEHAVWLGHIEEKVHGKYLVPVVGAPEPLPEEPQGLVFSGNRFTCSFEGRMSLESYGLTRGIRSAEQVFDQGSLKGPSLTMAKHDGADHALVVLEDRGTSRIHAWRVDGSAPPGTVIVAELPSAPSALARRANFGLAAACKNGHGNSVLQLRGGELSQYDVREGIRAVGYAPAGNLVYLAGDGRLHELDSRLREPTSKARRDISIDGNFDTLLVTACDEVVLCKLGESALLVVPQAPAISAVPLKYPCPITALTASVDGRCLIVGLADGSAYLLDARKSLIQPTLHG